VVREKKKKGHLRDNTKLIRRNEKRGIKSEGRRCWKNGNTPDPLYKNEKRGQCGYRIGKKEEFHLYRKKKKSNLKCAKKSTFGEMGKEEKREGSCKVRDKEREQMLPLIPKKTRRPGKNGVGEKKKRGPNHHWPVSYNEKKREVGLIR